jgi:hypothetical protein
VLYGEAENGSCRSAGRKRNIQNLLSPTPPPPALDPHLLYPRRPPCTSACAPRRGAVCVDMARGLSRCARRHLACLAPPAFWIRGAPARASAKRLPSPPPPPLPQGGLERRSRRFRKGSLGEGRGRRVGAAGVGAGIGLNNERCAPGTFHRPDLPAHVCCCVDSSCHTAGSGARSTLPKRAIPCAPPRERPWTPVWPPVTTSTR